MFGKGGPAVDRGMNIILVFDFCHDELFALPCVNPTLDLANKILHLLTEVFDFGGAAHIPVSRYNVSDVQRFNHSNGPIQP
ncbi:hypothetical protein RN69_38395 [Bradyrhizobium japonicum]|nr:hypothetical protein RN69_38395 [Bradyrhizobium japonicum]KMK00042.1 hypothetical protein CF64_05165 [Bradyrhizobium japonicum]